jgi:endogenous inhibitor of DNA gyrase (YacG/DUF329 family)
MGIPFPQPRYMPCSDCGAAVERAKEDKHVCERTRLVDFQMIQLRDEVASVEDELGAYFDSPQGRFEIWWAERERRREGGQPSDS